MPDDYLIERMLLDRGGESERRLIGRLAAACFRHWCRLANELASGSRRPDRHGVQRAIRLGQRQAGGSDQGYLDASRPT